MKYEEEYKKSKDIKEFIKLCTRKTRKYVGVSEATFKRRYYDLRKHFNEQYKKTIKKTFHIKERKEINKTIEIDYDKIFSYSKNYKDFAQRVVNIKPDMNIKSAQRRYYEVKKRTKFKQPELNKIINVYNNVNDEKLYTPPDEIKVNKEEKETNYLSSEKIKPSYMKMMQLNDMLNMYDKNRVNRDFLRKYGFNDMEINWLEDENKIVKLKGRT